MTMPIDVIAGLLLAVGALFVFTGGVGALRMPDFYTRMHAASLTDSLGTILILVGAAVHAGWSLAAVKLAMILAFMLFTSPTAAYALANAARIAGVPGTARPRKAGEP